MNIQIKSAEISDIEGISEIENICFSHPRSKEGLIDDINRSSTVFLCAVLNERVIAYGSMDGVIDEGYIINIATHPDFRRLGAAKMIVSSLMDYCRDNNYIFITLEVRKSNDIAVSLYKKMGFSIVGERKDFYRSPKENAYIMTHYFNEYERAKSL